MSQGLSIARWTPPAPPAVRSVPFRPTQAAFPAARRRAHCPPHAFHGRCGRSSSCHFVGRRRYPTSGPAQRRRRFSAGSKIRVIVGCDCRLHIQPGVGDGDNLPGTGQPADLLTRCGNAQDRARTIIGNRGKKGGSAHTRSSRFSTWRNAAAGKLTRSTVPFRPPLRCFTTPPTASSARASTSRSESSVAIRCRSRSPADCPLRAEFEAERQLVGRWERTQPA